MIEDINPGAAQKLLKIFLLADLHYQLNGTPVEVTLTRESRRQLGQTRRVLRKVAALGSGAREWMDYFIEAMNDEA